MSGSGGFLRGIGFCAAHFADADDFRIKTERHVQKQILIDVLLFVFAGARERMDDAVYDLAVFFPNQRQLTRAVFYGKNPFGVGNGGQ